MKKIGCLFVWLLSACLNAEAQSAKGPYLFAYFKDNGMVIKDLKHRIDWAWEE